VAGATWWAAIRIMTEVGELMRRTEDDQAHVGYSVAGRSRDRVTLCAVCTVHVEARSAGFLIDLKTTGTVCQWFDLKITGTVSPGLVSEPVVEGFPV
jgi:hypothetical protein